MGEQEALLLTHMYSLLVGTYYVLTSIYYT